MKRKLLPLYFVLLENISFKQCKNCKKYLKGLMRMNKLLLEMKERLLFKTLSWRRSLSCRNQSLDLRSKSMDWFLYDRDIRHERVKTPMPRCWSFWVSDYLHMLEIWTKFELLAIFLSLVIVSENCQTFYTRPEESSCY